MRGIMGRVLNATKNTYVMHSQARDRINSSLAQNSNFSSVQRLFDRRQTIPPRKDVLWRIERGVVRALTWGEDGVFITLGYWGVGDLIGHPLSCIEPYQLECLTSVEVSIIPPQLWREDIDALILHVQQAEELLSIVHRKPICQRVWLFLVWLGNKFGKDAAEGRAIDLTITHQEIAEVLNTTRVTVTRLLQQFEDEKKIVRNKRKIILRTAA
jgi:CRP-like cAMP-binding protein